MTAEPQDVEAPARAPRHLERRRYKRTPGEQLDYVREAVPHNPEDAEAIAPAVGPTAPDVTPDAAPAVPVPTAAPASPGPRPRTSPAPMDPFTVSRSRAPVYNPGGQTAAQYASHSRRSGSSQSVVTSRRRRSGAGRLVALGVLAALGLGGWQAYPTVHAKAVDWAEGRVTEDVSDVAAAQGQYRQLYGRYTVDLSALSLSSGVDDVQVVSADDKTFCLRGAPVVGPQVWFTPAGGQSSTPCA